MLHCADLHHPLSIAPRLDSVHRLIFALLWPFYEITGSEPLLIAIPGAAGVEEVFRKARTRTYRTVSGGHWTFAAVFPERVQTMVDHKPPIVSLLPAAAKWWAFFDGIYDTSARMGFPKPCTSLRAGLLEASTVTLRIGLSRAASSTLT